jgi:LuxR family maltose regulon positive regulatory protein
MTEEFARVLTSYLDESVDDRLTLVIANAGLSPCAATLRQWAARRAEPVAWCALEAADDDPTHFLTTLIDAVRRTPLAVKDMEPTDGLEAALTDLLNAFLASGQTAILVLQNYHVIKHPAIHRAMGWMLDYLPPNVHLLIISASEPPIPNLARLRVRRQMLELRMSD